MEKLSEIIAENEEIITDVNDLIKESKNYKKLDKESLEKHIEKFQNLLLDVDDIIEVILTCKKENDPTLATFDSDKKSSHAKALKAKKALEDNVSNLEKFYKKNFENSISKEQVDSEKIKKKPSISVEKSGDVPTEVGESISKTPDNNEEEKIPKEKTKKKSENKKNKKSKKENKEEKIDNDDKEEEKNKDDKVKSSEDIEATSTKNSQKSTKKGILKSSFKNKDKGKNKNKQDDKNEIQEVEHIEHKEEDKGLNDDVNLNTASLVSKDRNITNKNLDDNNEKPELDQNIPTNESEHDDNEININSKLNETTNEVEKLSKKNKKLTKSKKEKVSKVKTSKESKTKLKESESKDSDKNSSAGDLSIKKEKKNKSDISENKNEAEIENRSNNFTGIKAVPKIIEKEMNVIESQNSSLLNEASETTIQSQFSSKVRSYSDEEDQNMLQIGNKYVLTKTYSSEEEDDLSVTEGEEILLLDIMEDDWCYVKNNRGETGYIPKSYLKVNINLPKPKIEEILVPKHNEDENEKCLDTLKEDYMPESEPGTKIEDSSDSWVKIKQSMQEKTINDVLKECGHLPSGFRYSTICSWSKENSNNSSFIAYLCPKLSDSHLNFCELQIDQGNSQQKIQRQLQLIKLNKFPFISEKFVVKSRHVRICLFNGNKVLSNIHLIRATVSGKNLTTWNFNLKVSEDMKSMEFGEVFLKFNQSSTDLSILMEFCIQGFKTKLDTVANIDTLKNIDEDFTNDELLEFSIGWTSIPLYESNGQPISTKKGDYVLNGGTPFEKGIEVDPLSKNDNSVKPKFMVNQNKQPYVTIRLSVPSKENKELIDTLPSMIIGSTLHLVLLSFYRRLLAESILDPQRNLTSTKSIYSPFLVSFTQAVECPIILDTLRNIWNEKLKTSKDLNKKDQAKMNEFFLKVYMDFVYPLTKLKDFINYITSKDNLLQNEERKLSEIIQKMKLDIASILVTEEHSFAPLQFSELDFNIMSRYVKHK